MFRVLGYHCTNCRDTRACPKLFFEHIFEILASSTHKSANGPVVGRIHMKSIGLSLQPFIGSDARQADM